ncbi:hypothetical protein T492DRAFT_855812 [Pavlovales sp. CCMP2436]|nr:hypothetical protein T492DRAFT_855812 [Pavlovales sp. CCMP2436]
MPRACVVAGGAALALVVISRWLRMLAAAAKAEPAADAKAVLAAVPPPAAKAEPAADATAPAPAPAALAKSVRVFYGSETGKAEAFARELGAEARRRGVDVQVESLARWRTTLLARPGEFATPDLLVLLLSTHGEGEPPEGARDFCAALKAGTVEVGSPFCVFGLGNRAYQHFCAVACRVDRGLAHGSDGALRALPLALGDDGGNLRADYAAWLEVLWRTLGVPPAAGGATGLADDADGGSYELAYVSAPLGDCPEAMPESCGVTLLDQVRSFPALVLAAGTPGGKLHAVGASFTEPRARSAGACSERLSLRLRLPAECAALLDVGDHLGVWPTNPPVVVARLATRLRLRLSALSVLRAPRRAQLAQVSADLGAGANGSAARPEGAREEGAWEYRFACPCTIRDMLARYLDVLSPLPPKVLGLLARSCAQGGAGERRGEAGDGAAQREALLELARGGARYAEWASGLGSGLAEALTQFPAAQPDCACLFALLPRLHPRYFSLASDPRAGAGAGAADGSVEVSLLATLQRLPSGSLGVASAHFARAKPLRDSLLVFARASRFKLPDDAGTPLVLVAAGSGLAPFIGFLERRQLAAGGGGAGVRAGTRPGTAQLGEARLYLGCRTELEVPFRAQLEEWVASGVLSSCVLALSREPPPRTVQRVQHVLAVDGALLAALLERGAVVYVCGSGGMAASVRDAFLAILAGDGQLGEERVRACLLELQAAGRYQQDGAAARGGGPHAETPHKATKVLDTALMRLSA